jgi:hypothetical protein
LCLPVLAIDLLKFRGRKTEDGGPEDRTPEDRTPEIGTTEEDQKVRKSERLPVVSGQ